MKKSFFHKLFLLFTLITLPALVFANGFQINEQGVKSLGMGGAFVAQADNPDAVYYNPAGITQLEGAQISLGLSPITPTVTFDSDQTGKSTDAKKQTFYIPIFYATLKATDRVSVGFGTFSNYGLATEWPSDWEGRYITGGTKAEIVTLTLNPNLAVKVTDKLSLAVGVDIQKMEVTLENKLKIVPYEEGYILLNGDGDSQLKADDWAYGYNVALHYSITKNWKAGISYRSKIKHEIKDGTASISLPSGNLYNSTFTGILSSTPAMSIQKTGSTDITLPDILYIGTSYKLGKFTFELDGQWTGWSSYDKLEVTFEDGSVQSKPKDWDDVWAIRFGMQYKVNDMLDLRAGLIRDYSPIPDETLDPLVSSGDRWLYALGFGLNFENLSIDFAYNYLDDENRTFNNKVGSEAPYDENNPMTGEFKSADAHIFGISVTYRFK
ncbi:outer membrane protein transport protein [Deferribacterales bacterium Es71-Z0220]|uniref:OmpP1/FadL family transporter n=1 Tax=Deferrivibrio essentukiensis TaxID=2880922 RepID=UPI001F61A47E|nr:outer membrane protein transport protein [Deferrivibrio essentukiensis]MCB4204699.1 outer membrane protein transport protein [Deferrivibrio essentukiensis]